jgi:hypothetical protein
MNNPIIYWVIGGLLILFYFYLIYRFTKTWRVWHVMFAFLVFSAALTLLVFASMTLRTLNAWRTLAEQQKEQIEAEQQTRDDMLYGNLTEVIQTTPSVRSLKAQLRRSELDRGRVWRGCTHSQPTPNDSVTVNTVPAGVAEAEAEPNHIEQNAILYLFVEDLAPETVGLPEGAKVPRFYVGEFIATDVTDSSVTLKPSFPLDNFEKQLLRQGNATWALYETMPVDGHQFYASDPDKQPDLSLSADEEPPPVFGEMDEEAIKELMAPQRQLVSTDEEFVALLDPYLRDGKRASQDDPPEDVWLKVEFEKQYELPVSDVDTSGDPLGAIVTSEDFFDRGRAEVALLRLNRDAEFQKGDIALFPQYSTGLDDLDVQDLVDDGICRIVDRVFVRTLNDYKRGFRDISQQMQTLAHDINQVQRDTAETERANELTLGQIRQSEEERDKINQDLEKVRYEQEQITQYAASLNDDLKALKKELSDLYRTNRQLVEQLAQLDADVTAKINRRTLEAVE